MLVAPGECKGCLVQSRCHSWPAMLRIPDGSRERGTRTCVHLPLLR
jgi:hypothetical protein